MLHSRVAMLQGTALGLELPSTSRYQSQSLVDCTFLDFVDTWFRLLSAAVVQTAKDLDNPKLNDDDAGYTRFQRTQR